jgi:hypothetical protein
MYSIVLDAQLSEFKTKWILSEPSAYSYTLWHGGVFGYTVEKISVRKGACRARAQFVYGKNRVY